MLEYQEHYTNFQKDARLINNMYRAAEDCLRASIYRAKTLEYMNEKHPKPERASSQGNKQFIYWLVRSSAFYYDCCVVNFCKIFGADSEETHYKNLIDPSFSENIPKILEEVNIDVEKKLKEKILEGSGISEKTYKLYVEEAKKYRNQALVHTNIKDETIKKNWRSQHDAITLISDEPSEDEKTRILEGRRVFLSHEQNDNLILYFKENQLPNIINLVNDDKELIDYLMKLNEKKFVKREPIKCKGSKDDDIKFFDKIFQKINNENGDINIYYPTSDKAINLSLEILKLLVEIIKKLPEEDGKFKISYFDMTSSKIRSEIESEISVVLSSLFSKEIEKN